MLSACRASILHCVADPGESGSAATEYFDDGVLIVDEGRIKAIGPADVVGPQFPNAELETYDGGLILPGFVDCHVHSPQIDAIASYGEQLLDWLDHYAYPAEVSYADPGYARDAAGFFLDELLANGTTTAAVFATVHEHSAEALFEAAAERRMRLIAGKVLMDRNCPPELRDDPQSAYRDSKRLIDRWHGNGRLGYAITPRFALTSSETELEAAGRVAAEFPDAWVQTHLAENDAEIEAVGRQFAWSKNYLDVYERFGLVRDRSIFAHCLHLTDADRGRLAAGGGAAAFCPTSNLFLGSGLFDLAAMKRCAVPVGLATDVGGGTSLSMFRTMAAAYEVLQLGGQSLPAEEALYLATLGAARALGLDADIGNFAPGKEADFIVVDPSASRLARRRWEQLDSIGERLFALIMLGDDRHVAATYVEGRRTRHG